MAKPLVQKMIFFPCRATLINKENFSRQKDSAANFEIERKGQQIQHWIIFRLDS